MQKVAMKVVVLNYCGTVGKTTLAAHWLAPRLEGAKLLAVETINETGAVFGLDVEKVKGREWQAIYKELLSSESVIIDVGASNVEPFLAGLVKFDDAHEEVDFFVVPVTPDAKAMRESINTVITLSDMGIPADKIRVVCNRVEEIVSVEFSKMINFARKEKLCLVNEAAAIDESQIFDLLSVKRKTLADVLADPVDYRAEVKKMERTDKRYAFMQDMAMLKSLARGVQRNFDQAFAATFDEVLVPA